MIRCQLHRWRMARCLDDGAALPARTQQHLDGCASCRAQYERERQCVGQLSAEAEAGCLPAPPYLRQRVIANLESWGQRPAPAPAVRGWTAALAGAAMVVALGLVVWPRSQTQSHPVAVNASAVEALAALELIPNGTTMLELGSRLDEPLQGELDSVMLDARNALAALSRGFALAEPERR